MMRDPVDPARPVAMVAVAAVHVLAIAALLATRPPTERRAIAPVVETFLLFAPEPAQPQPDEPLDTAAQLAPVRPEQPTVEIEIDATDAPVTQPALAVPAAIESAPSSDSLAAAGPAAVREIESVDYLVAPQPRYPAVSRRLREQGTVWLRVLVGEDGYPREAQVIRSSGSPRLDSAAQEAIMAASFRPYLENSQPRAAYVRVPIEFALRRG